jgi:hypothetical protein
MYKKSGICWLMVHNECFSTKKERMQILLDIPISVHDLDDFCMISTYCL